MTHGARRPHMLAAPMPLEFIPPCSPTVAKRVPAGPAVDDLRPHYRMQVAEQGFVVVYRPLATFNARV